MRARQAHAANASDTVQRWRRTVATCRRQLYCRRSKACAAQHVRAVLERRLCTADRLASAARDRALRHSQAEHSTTRHGPWLTFILTNGKPQSSAVAKPAPQAAGTPTPRLHTFLSFFSRTDVSMLIAGARCDAPARGNHGTPVAPGAQNLCTHALRRCQALPPGLLSGRMNGLQRAQRHLSRMVPNTQGVFPSRAWLFGAQI